MTEPTPPPAVTNVQTQLTVALADYQSLHAYLAGCPEIIAPAYVVDVANNTEPQFRAFMTVINNAFAVRDAGINTREAEIARLTEINNAGLQQVAHMNDEINTFRGLAATLQAVVNAGGGGGGEARTSMPSLPHATKFTGEEKETRKRTTEFQEWASTIKTRWSLRPTEFPTEYHKLLYIRQLLGGQAYSSIRTGMEVVDDNPNTPATWPWATGRALLAELDNRYARFNLVADAENQLAKMEQKGQWKVFADFLSEYTNLTNICNWDDATKVRELKKKLSSGLHTALKYQTNQPGREDWAGWVTLLQELATLQEADEFRKELQGGHSQNNNSNGQNNTNSNGTKAKNPDAMEVDAVRVNRISDEQRDRCRAEGLCYKCCQAGHISKDCTNPARGGRGGARGSARGGGRGRGAAQQQYGAHPQGQGYGQNGYGQWGSGYQQGSYQHKYVPQQQQAPRSRGGGYQQARGVTVAQMTEANTAFNRGDGFAPYHYPAYQNTPMGFVMGEVPDTTNNNAGMHFQAGLTDNGSGNA